MPRAVSRYDDALKRGVNGASEIVVIDESFFTGSCLPIRRRVQQYNGETPSGTETSAKNLKCLWANRKFSSYTTESNLGGLASSAGWWITPVVSVA